VAERRKKEGKVATKTARAHSRETVSGSRSPTEKKRCVSKSKDGVVLNQASLGWGGAGIANASGGKGADEGAQYDHKNVPRGRRRLGKQGRRAKEQTVVNAREYKKVPQKENDFEKVRERETKERH